MLLLQKYIHTVACVSGPPAILDSRTGEGLDPRQTARIFTAVTPTPKQPTLRVVNQVTVIGESINLPTLTPGD
jgi:hypothetical protein